MKKAVLAFAIIGSFSASVLADDGAKLAQQKGCLGCHQVDKKVVGPSYKDVAKKYAGQPDATDKLAKTIQNGGVGNWGQVPMPKNNVTSAEAKTLAAWVMAQK